MSAFPTLESLVVEFEGLHRLGRDGLVYPYLCPAGYPTQGYGILVESMSAPPITREEAVERMRRALPVYFAQTLRLAPELARAPLPCAEAIADFVFNLGTGRFAGSTLRRRIRAGDWPGALAELPKWRMGGGVVLPGLVRRRAAEVAVIRAALRL